MAWWVRQVAVSQVRRDMVHCHAVGCWYSLPPHCPLHGTETVSRLTCWLIILLCSLDFFSFSNFVSGDLTLTGFLTSDMNIQLLVFWSTESWAWGQDSAICAGLAHGRDHSYCRALDSGSEQKSQKCLAFLFPWIVKNTWKTTATLENFSTLIPRTFLTWHFALGKTAGHLCLQSKISNEDACLAMLRLNLNSKNQLVNTDMKT